MHAGRARLLALAERRTDTRQQSCTRCSRPTPSRELGSMIQTEGCERQGEAMAWGLVSSRSAGFNGSQVRPPSTNLHGGEWHDLKRQSPATFEPCKLACGPTHGTMAVLPLLIASLALVGIARGETDACIVRTVAVVLPAHRHRNRALACTGRSIPVVPSAPLLYTGLFSLLTTAGHGGGQTDREVGEASSIVQPEWPGGPCGHHCPFDRDARVSPGSALCTEPWRHLRPRGLSLSRVPVHSVISSVFGNRHSSSAPPPPRRPIPGDCPSLHLTASFSLHRDTPSISHNSGNLQFLRLSRQSVQESHVSGSKLPRGILRLRAFPRCVTLSLLP